MSPFRLFPAETHFWSFGDYAAVLDVMAKTRPASVLEFGPGSSTLALIEGGAARIDACEDDPAWFTVYRDRLERRYPAVRLRPYRWQPELRILGVDGERYDLALIDGPHAIDRRPAAIAYACARAVRVLMPTEEAEGRSLRPDIDRIAAAEGRLVTYIDTGPPSGAFALMGPRTC